MKKLLIILQLIGILAICPVYVVLEMTHATITKQVKREPNFTPVR